MKKRLEDDKVYTEINSDDVEGEPEIHVIPNRAKAKALGIAVSEISRAVQVLFGGFPAASYSKGGQRYDVIVQLREADRKKMENSARIMVRNNRGELLPLKELVRFETKKTPPTIVRQDRVRAVTITSNLTEAISQQEAMDRV